MSAPSPATVEPTRHWRSAFWHDDELHTTRMNMNPILRHLLKLALVTAATTIPSVANAAGLLGHQWASVTFDYITYESAAFNDSSGVTLEYNRPIKLPVVPMADIGLSLRSFDRDSARAGVPDLEGKQFLLNTTFIGPTDETTPYLRLGLGWAEAKAGGVTRDSLMHAIGIGAELPDMAGLVVSGFVDWTDSFDGDIDGTLTYGCLATYAVAETFDVLVRAQGDDHYNITGSVGVVVRF